ncbi:PXA domain-containing protein [Aspergillus californicus]
MTTDPVPLGLQPFSHLKADPTISSSKSTAIPSSPTTPTSSQSLHRPLLSKNISRDEQVNGTNDKATTALIRRVLCPQPGSYGGATSPYAPEELLPPLTSSNDVDRQLYALISIIVKEFISSWYSKITSDQALINETLQVIAHCTRALEQRLRQTDIAQLVLDELPALVEAHISSYRLAKEQSNVSGLSPFTREIYHALNPHPGLSPLPDLSDPGSISLQQDNEATYRRLLVNGVLAVLLPTEDLENACLRTLTNDIIADLIMGNEVAGKMCEGWFLWESITKLLEVLSRDKDVGSGDKSAAKESSRPDRLQQFGLLPSKNESNRSSSTVQWQAPSWIWHILQYAFVAYVTLRFIVAGLFRVASTPPAILTSRTSPSGNLVDELPTKYSHIEKRPVLGYRLFGMLSQLLDIPRRMPWLGGLLCLFQYLTLAGPGRVGGTGSVIDRFLYENIEEYILTPTLLPNLLLASREALFPHNTRPKPGVSVNRIEALTLTGISTPASPNLRAQPSSTFNDAQATTASGANSITPVISSTTAGSSPSPPDQQRHPSTAEIALMRRKCAVGILSLAPRPIARQLFGIVAETGSEKNSASGQPRGGSPESETAASKQDPCSLDSESPRASPSPDDVEESFLLSAIENDILDLFEDEYCNKYLIYSIIETVLAKLLPELSDHSIAELMENRGVSLSTGRV